MRMVICFRAVDERVEELLHSAQSRELPRASDEIRRPIHVMNFKLDSATAPGKRARSESIAEGAHPRGDEGAFLATIAAVLQPIPDRTVAWSIHFVASLRCPQPHLKRRDGFLSADSEAEVITSCFSQGDADRERARSLACDASDESHSGGHARSLDSAVHR